jgi:hypothetical protein
MKMPKFQAKRRHPPLTRPPSNEIERQAKSGGNNFSEKISFGVEQTLEESDSQLTRLLDSCKSAGAALSLLIEVGRIYRG